MFQTPGGAWRALRDLKRPPPLPSCLLWGLCFPAKTPRPPACPEKNIPKASHAPYPPPKYLRGYPLQSDLTLTWRNPGETQTGKTG
jgi:hypothetical protein